MNENENLVTEVENVEEQTDNEVTENVEQTTEQSPKTYTEAEFNAELDRLLGKKIARREARIRKEYERKYGDLEEVLKAGTGKQSVDEMTDAFKQFYASKGINIPDKPNYSEKDIETLAIAEANEIIRSGYEDVVEEVDRLAEIGTSNMSAREKALFKALVEHRQTAERTQELAKIGVTDDVYNSQEFQDFRSMFKDDTPITKVYEQYRKTKPQKEIRTAGSMKQSQDYKGVKDYYSPEEIERMTEEDLDDPKVWEAVRRSMTSR